MPFVSPQKLSSPVSLKREKISSISHVINWAIENLLFWRNQYFKNHPRTNFLLLRSLLIVPSYTLLVLSVFVFLNWLFYHTFGFDYFIDKDKGTGLINVFTQCLIATDGKKFEFNNVFIAYLGATSLCYWNISNVFRQQWTHSNDIYTKMLQAKPEIASEISHSLAIDVLVQDLWAHRSFADLFTTELEEAIEFHYGPGSQVIIDRTNRGELTECEAKLLLEKLQTKPAKTRVKNVKKTTQRRVVLINKKAS